MKTSHTILIISIISTVLFLKCTTNKTVLFKDNFESYANKRAVEKVWNITGKGSVSIDTSHYYSGKQSIRFNTGEGFSKHAFINLKSIFPLVENSFSGQFKMYVEEASPNGIHWTFLQASGTVKNEKYTAQVRYGGQHHKQLMANYDTKGIKTDCWQHSSTTIPEKEWFTIKWLFDGNTNTMKLWLNTLLIETISLTNYGEGCVQNELNNKWVFPIFDTLSLGWADYQKGGGTRTVWIDDVILFK